MIRLYTAATSNGRRVSIMLEETGLSYDVKHINLSEGEQRESEFLKLNPAHGIPVIVDQESDHDEPLVLTQSVAILIYLAEKSGQMIPSYSVHRAQMYQWLMYDATDITQVRLESSRLGWNDFKEASEFLHGRVLHRYEVVEQHLSQHQYLAGNDYSIADISAYPWAKRMELDAITFPNITRWLSLVGSRPAVQRGMKIPK